MAAPAATATKPEETKPKPSPAYPYLFEADKGPTKVLDALLRAIAQHIVSPPVCASTTASRLPQNDAPV